MSIRTLRAVAKLPTAKPNQALVIGLRKTGKNIEVVSANPVAGLPSANELEKLGAKTSFEAQTKVLAGGQVVLILGLGDGELQEDELRELAGTASRALSEHEEIVFNFPNLTRSGALAIAEGSCLGRQTPSPYKRSTQKPTASKVLIVTKAKIGAEEFEQVLTVAAAVSDIRALVNMPPNQLYPQTLASKVKSLAKGSNLSVEIWDEAKLKAEGCAGILSVGQGSVRPPRLVKISYRPKGAKKHLALVGKGITFDSGGLTIKPGLGMLGMKYDMTGAATVGLTAIAIAKLGLPVRVTAYLCLAENLPSGSATRPSDVIKFRNGTTVEITNTDAEGRLVLADGLVLASESQPDLIVDVATLTGAVRVALGVRTAGLMGTSDGVNAVKQAADVTGEKLWPMPMPKELRSKLDSDVADLINSKLGDPAGSMLVGAHFLSEFVGTRKIDGKKLSWAHLDIAGSANNDGSAYGYTPKGATGVMLRTLVEVAKSL